MALSERQWNQWAAMAFLVAGAAKSALFLIVKATTSRLASAPWPEVMFGPFLTVGCAFLLFCAAGKIECWVSDRLLLRAESRPRKDADKIDLTQP